MKYLTLQVWAAGGAIRIQCRNVRCFDASKEKPRISLRLDALRTTEVHDWAIHEAFLKGLLAFHCQALFNRYSNIQNSTFKVQLSSLNKSVPSESVPWTIRTFYISRVTHILVLYS